MATTFYATYQITLSTSNKDHAKDEVVSAYIRRTSPSTLNTTGVSVSSATIDMSGTTFWSAAGNNPYLDFRYFGRAYVPNSISNKTAISLYSPSGFSLDNLLGIGTSDTAMGIYGYKSTSGNICTYASTAAVLTVTALCVQNYTKSSAAVTQSVDAGAASTVTFSNPNLSAVYHTVTWRFGSSSKSTTTASGAGSASYTIPLSWLTNIPSATSGTATVDVTTYANDGTGLGTNSYSFTINAPSTAVPSLTLAVTRIDNTVPTAWGVYVQGKSGVKITATASGYQGSTITGYSLSGAATGTQTTGVFTISPISTGGSNSFTVRVTDSRGRTATASTSISVVVYASPVFTATQAFRCVSGGTASDTGTYVSAKANGTYSSVSGKNTCTLQVQYGLSTGSAYSTPTALAFNTASVIGGGSIDVNASYRIRFTLTDAFGSVEKIVNVGTAAYTVFFRQGGNGVAFGKVSERANAVEINADWGLYHGNNNLAGTVPLSRGGTGATTVAAARNALGLGNTAGALPIANGGTGATSAAAARNALGLGNTTGALPIANGGTGATTAVNARTNLGITLANLGAAATSHNHGAGNITSGTLAAARLPFKYAYGSTSISGSSSVNISYSSAGFSAVPYVFVTYSTTGANWSGDNGAIKVHSKTTAGCSIVVGGSFNTARNVDWFAIGT